MNIFVNAVALKAAGGRSVALNFLKAAREASHGVRLHVVAPGGCGYEELACESVVIHTVPPPLGNAVMRPVLDHVWIPRLIAAIRPDAVFSMGNIALRTRAKQLLLFHWPYAIYPESRVWRDMDRSSRISRRIRLRAFERRLRYATVIAAQTETAKARLERLYPTAAGRVVVVPNAVSLPSTDGAAHVTVPFERRSEKERWLLCLTRYYPHKNVEILLELARLVKECGSGLRVVTTIGADQHPKAAEFLRLVHERNLDDVIVNLGPVSMDQVPGLYAAVDGMILPTLLESFSGTYVEAMHYGVPVFTSDLDFARDVCRDAAYYFDPMNAEQIFECIAEAFDDPDEVARRVDEGRRLVTKMPDWHVVAESYLSVIRELVQHG